MNSHKKQNKLYGLSYLRKKLYPVVLSFCLFSVLVLSGTTKAIAFSSVFKTGPMPENTLQSGMQSPSPADPFGSSVLKKGLSDNMESAQNEIASVTKDETELTGPSFYKAGPLHGIPLAQKKDPGNIAIDAINLLGRPSLYKSHSEVTENTAAPEMIEIQNFTGSPFKSNILNNTP